MAFEFSNEEERKLFEDVLNGRVHLFNLPVKLYNRIAEELTSTVYRAFNIDTGTSLNNPDFETPRLLKRNLYDFSAAKTFQQIQDLQNFIFNEKGFRRNFSEFEQYAKGIFDTYNRNWLEAEFETATNMADGAARWEQIENEKDIFPLLKYNTLRDGSVRDEHKPLEGIVKPVDDPFWSNYYPPNGWRCRCFTEQLEEDEEPITDTSGKDLIKPDLIFDLNPAKEKVIFRMDGKGAHPYAEVKSRFRRHKENNFGLPLPPDVRDVKKPKPKVEVLKTEPSTKEINFATKKDKEIRQFVIDEMQTKQGLTLEKIQISRSADRIALSQQLNQMSRLLSEYKISEAWNKSKTAKGAFVKRGSTAGSVSFKWRYQKEGRDIYFNEINFGHREKTISQEINDKHRFDRTKLNRKSRVDEKNINIATTTHEFAHFIAVSELQFSIKGKERVKSYFDELKEIRSQYSKEVKNLMLSGKEKEAIKIYLGDYANTNIDEFMAEGFTEYKLATNPSKYAIKIGKLIDKYFKK